MKFLLETEKWDFFMVHFTMLDRVQHWYWKSIARTVTRFVVSLKARIQNGM